MSSFISTRFLSNYNATYSTTLAALDLIRLQNCLDTSSKVNTIISKHLILVNIQSQKLHLLDSASNYSYTVSTAATGAGQEEVSGKTPLGLHVIQEKNWRWSSSLCNFFIA